MSGQVVRVNRVVQMVFCDNCDAIKTSDAFIQARIINPPDPPDVSPIFTWEPP